MFGSNPKKQMSMIKPSKAGERLGLLGLSETDMMSLYKDLGKTKDDGLRLLQNTRFIFHY